MDQFSTYAKNLFNAVNGVSGEILSYSACVSGSVVGICNSISMNKGRSRTINIDSRGGRIEGVSDDWIVRASDISLAITPSMSNTVWKPQEGDILSWATTVNGFSKTVTFELVEPPATPFDSKGEFVRLHSKQVSVS